MDDPLRRLPPVNDVLDHPALTVPLGRLGRARVREAVRTVLEEVRGAIRRGEAVATDPGSVASRAVRRLEADPPGLRTVLNASGVLLHTGLGRAPLAAEAAEAVAAVVRGYCDLEFDLDSGERGSRTTRVADLLRRLTGAEAATVVNNNAAATILALRATALGREVVVSRGQLVEIGGSFRLPEIFAVSGVRLREVGTTNKTRLSDYEAAIGPDTAALLRVHASNFRIVGFVESVAVADLARLARSRGLWCLDDVGSGALGPGLPPGVGDEPTAAEGIAAGADLVLFSGDKLLGGPQCGLIVGTSRAIGLVARDPLMRAVRVGKMTLAALEATLLLALDPIRGPACIPLWAALASPTEELISRAEALAERLRHEAGLMATAVATVARLGGGSAPDEPIPSAAVRIGPPFPATVGSEGALARALRRGGPPVVARVQRGAVLLDLRAIPPAEDDQLASTVARASREADDLIT